jgi:ribosomal protein S18 acetylase RimI-like enzyme
MKHETQDFEIHASASDAYEQLAGERRRTLVGPEDDMWAAFADRAEPYALMVGAKLVGRFSVDVESQVHGFYVSEEFEAVAAELFVRVVDEMSISAAMASTVDPRFLSLSLAAGCVAQPVALMYEHIGGAESDESVDVRLAASADHSAAVGFYQAENGSSEPFVTPFVAERIEHDELYLVEADGKIVATGECRVDNRAPGNAHLGLVVGSELRNQGMGSRLMHTLTEICKNQDMTPLCSTEPSNTAAQRVIRRAGFRSRHQVFNVSTTGAKK